jgi:DNA-directed RNA polymerase subunit M/transcription elongation factor TFIIS
MNINKMTTSVTTKELRANGIKSLETVLKQEQNIKIIESYIHKNASKTDCYEENYRKIVYQTVGDVLNSLKLKDIVKNIKNDLVLWKHPVYKSIKNRIYEHDDFIINPFEVEEGVTKCGKCGSERVFTYQKQTRGSDEPMTTFAKCVKCKVNWSYSG